MTTLVMKNTSKNSEYAEKYADLCSDYELGFLTDDQFEKELKKLKASTVEKTDFENCNQHPYWSLIVNNLKGEILAINEDGTYDVKFHHPSDPIFEMKSKATMILESSSYWLTDEQKESRISHARKILKVGDQVSVSEYGNLFYIYTKLHRPIGALAYATRRGDPHIGYKREYRIDID